MRILSKIRWRGKPIFQCRRCGTCCHYVFPLFTPDLTKLEKATNLSKMRGYVKVYLSEGNKPPQGIRLFLDAGNPERPPTERVPCPFLESDKTCAIYDDRPLACRRFPLGTDPGKGPCPHWNGRPDQAMTDADDVWKREEREISKIGAAEYYDRWLQLLYPKGYIPKSAIRKGVYWSQAGPR